MNFEHVDSKLLVAEAITEDGKIRKIVSLLYDDDMSCVLLLRRHWERQQNRIGARGAAMGAYIQGL